MDNISEGWVGGGVCVWGGGVGVGGWGGAWGVGCKVMGWINGGTSGGIN